MAKTPIMDKNLSLQDLLAKINKKYGAGTVARASTAKAMRIPRLETGIFAVDFATGGGIPLGRITGIYGKKSSGKTSLAIKIVASSQRYCREHWVKCVETDQFLFRCLECGYRGEDEGSICPECATIKIESHLVFRGDRVVVCPECKKYNPFITVWLDMEGAWENKWATSLGVDCRYVYVIRGEYAEQAIDVADSILRSGGCDILVIDTIAHMTPKIEIEETAEKWQMGVQARLVNKMLRKLVSAVNEPGVQKTRRPTVISLNQVRMKLGVMFGDPETRPGGMGQEFATSLDFKLWASKYTQDDVGNTLNVVVNFCTKKNKTAPPQQEGNFRMWLRSVEGHDIGSTEEFQVVAGLAIKYGLFGESPKYSFGDETFTSKKEIARFLFSDTGVFNQVRNRLLAMALGKVASDEDAMKISEEDLVGE